MKQAIINSPQGRNSHHIQLISKHLEVNLATYSCSPSKGTNYLIPKLYEIHNITSLITRQRSRND